MGCGASTAAVAPADVVPPQPDAATDGASPLKKANTVPSASARASAAETEGALEDLTEGEPVRDADDAAKWDFAFN